MTQTEQQRKQQRDRQILEELALDLAAGAGGYVVLVRIRGLLMELSFGLSYDNASWLATMVGGGNLPPDFGIPEGPCQRLEEEHAPAWLAMYLVAAAARLAEAQVPSEGPFAGPANTSVEAKAKEAEERYFQLHLQAEERRLRAAALQDMAARLNADRGEGESVEYLSWRAVMDERTTFECRMANGMNFRAGTMPAIGWPGAVHVHCRCSAGPEIPGAPVMPSI